METKKREACEVCCTNKTILICDLCKRLSCKKCSFFVDEDCFEYQSLLPENLREKAFCPNCFDESIGGLLTDYQGILSRAKNIDVYIKTQGAETRLMRRVEKPIKVRDCEDESEAMMHLAFLAAQKGYDTIVDVDIKSQKVGNQSYKKLIWSGVAVPVDSDKGKWRLNKEPKGLTYVKK